MTAATHRLSTPSSTYVPTHRVAIVGALLACACTSSTTTTTTSGDALGGGAGKSSNGLGGAVHAAGATARGGEAELSAGTTSTNSLGGTGTGGLGSIGGAQGVGGAMTFAGATSLGGAVSLGGTNSAGVATTAAGRAAGGINSGSGGTTPIGGATASGGSGGSNGGSLATGGSIATGGVTASGGTAATGGSIATGGVNATGGATSNPCNPNPCANTGTCTNGSSAATFVCQCTSGWVGATCSERLFEGLGTFSDRVESRARGVTADGTTVVGVASTATGVDDVGFQWKVSTGLRRLQCVTTSDPSVANAISGNGTMVVGLCKTSSSWIASTWSGGVFHGYLETGFTGNDADAEALSVNADASIVGGFHSAAAGSDYPNATIWSPNGRQILTWPSDGYESYISGISDDGSVAAGYTIEEPSTAVRVTASGTTWSVQVLPHLTGGTAGASAHGISRNGQVLVGSCSNTAVRWVGGQPSSLGISGVARATNSDGSVIVGFNQTVAFIWTATSVRLLWDVLDGLGAQGLGAWTFTDATGISANGKVIVGNGVHNGVVEAFIARLP